MKRIIRLPAVEERTGLKRSEIYERIKNGSFPKQVPLGPKAVGWLEHEIDAWIDRVIAQPVPRKEPIPKKKRMREGADAAA